jgi:hypothetical protein
MTMTRFILKFRGFALVMLCSLVYTGFAHGDEVTDTIKEGLQSYQEGKYSEAMNSLNYASQLIGQKKGGDLQAFLPKPLNGWEASEAASSAVGAAMMGGGVTAERRYNKDSATVTVRIVSDSPMLQGMMVMFTNPMMAGADGGKLEKIAGEKALVKYNAKQKTGEIHLAIANRFLVTVEGSEVPLEDLKAYAGKVDYKKLAALQ